MGQEVEQLTADERVEHYRKMAAAVRIAAASHSEECRDELERLAVSYETLATEVAKREACSPSRMKTAAPSPESRPPVA
jgi:hypothetical protein